MNIFAYTALRSSMPEYVSMNEDRGAVSLTSRDKAGVTVTVPIPHDEVLSLYQALGAYIGRTR